MGLKRTLAANAIAGLLLGSSATTALAGSAVSPVQDWTTDGQLYKSQNTITTPSGSTPFAETTVYTGGGNTVTAYKMGGLPRIFVKESPTFDPPALCAVGTSWFYNTVTTSGILVKIVKNCGNVLSYYSRGLARTQKSDGTYAEHKADFAGPA